MRVSVSVAVLLSAASLAEACANGPVGGHRKYQRRNDIPYREYPRYDAKTLNLWDLLFGQKQKPAQPVPTPAKSSSTKAASSTSKAASSTSKAASASTSKASSAAASSIAASVTSPAVAVSSITSASAVSTSFSKPPQTSPPVIPDVNTEGPAASAVPLVNNTSTAPATVQRVGGATVENHILVLARDDYAAESGFHGLEGYGIPYDRVLVPQAGIALPQLQTTDTHGRYSGIIVMDSVSYSYPEGWHSALTADQWQQLSDYQVRFGVRMVRINEYPGPAFGTTSLGSGSGSEQDITLTDLSQFPTANLKAGAGLTAKGLWHYPAQIANATIAKVVAQFAPDATNAQPTVAAVVNKFDDGREQFVWFTSWAPQWSTTCAALQHAHIHWLTRGLFLGKRKTHLNIQIDDLELPTDMYSPAGAVFRCRPEDLDGHAAWQRDLNSRLPPGSNVRLELGHNGNGDILQATNPTSNGACTPDYAVDYPAVPDTPLEFKKPLGTGVDFWPKEWTKYPWSYACTQRDPLTAWYSNAAKRDEFFHVSHTFTHEEMNNATYHDANLEIQFNQAWFAQTGISNGKFSPQGVIPPAITGLHNGDVIKAWMDNGIKHVVGDNTRPVLRSGESPYHPLISTVDGNGYAGLAIIPRWATSIYYNCDTWDCDVAEWKAISQGYGDYNDLLKNAKDVNTPYLFSLKSDPYMFHQANLRYADMPTITVGSKTAKMSMVMGWVESVAQEFARVTNWPLTSIKHDDFAQYFLDRATLDGCSPNVQYNFNAAGTAVVSVTVSAANANCPVEVPVTIPGGSVAGARIDQVGAEPPIAWVKLNGGATTLQLSTPVPL